MSERAKVAIQLTLDGASVVSRGLGGITSGVSSVAGGFATATATAAHFLAIGKDVVGLASRMASGVKSFTGAIIAPNIDFEDASVGFENLLGSADAARERIAALYDYANSTPFQNPDVLDAGIKLQNAGGAALGMGKGLEMVGDMAAYARKDLREVADWTARLYQNLKNGDPFMEAARRLMELNVMTGAEVNSLNALSESGADGTAMWGAFTKMMDKTNGSAKKMAGTMSGTISTIKGLWGEMKRMTGTKLFDVMKADLQAVSADMSEIFSTGTMDKFSEKFGQVIADIYTKLKTLTIGDMGLMDLAKAGMDGDLFGGIKAGLSAVASNFWSEMMTLARLYAPEIQAIFTPKRLQGILGINAGLAESMDDRRARIGEAKYTDPGKAFKAGATGMDSDWAKQFANAPVISHSQLMSGNTIAPQSAKPDVRVMPTVSEMAGSGTASAAATEKAAHNTANDMVSAEKSAANVAGYLEQAAEAARKMAELNQAASRLGSGGYQPARL